MMLQYKLRFFDYLTMFCQLERLHIVEWDGKFGAYPVRISAELQAEILVSFLSLYFKQVTTTFQILTCSTPFTCFHYIPRYTTYVDEIAPLNNLRTDHLISVQGIVSVFKGSDEIVK
jgi:hypothetical protein